MNSSVPSQPSAPQQVGGPSLSSPSASSAWTDKNRRTPGWQVALFLLVVVVSVLLLLLSTLLGYSANCLLVNCPPTSLTPTTTTALTSTPTEVRIVTAMPSSVSTVALTPTASPTSIPHVVIMPLPTADPATEVYNPRRSFEFGLPIFSGFFSRTGGVAFWGEHPNTPLIIEHYHEGNDKHLVQYFDKGRMEWHPSSEPTDLVRSGLLASELLSGYIQMGEYRYAKSCSPNIPMFGDNGPSYAFFQRFVDTIFVGADQAAGRVSYANRILPTDARTKDDIKEDSAKVDTYGDALKIALFTGDTTLHGHNLPQIFCDYLMRNLPYGTTCTSDGVPAEFWDLSGLPISEPYWWSGTKFNQSAAQDVMFQAFERRVLLYRPSSPPNERITVTNIGHDYFNWRYLHPIDPLQSPCP